MSMMIELTEQPLDLESMIAAVRSDACGAVVTFLGVVRETSDDARPVTGLTYQAYPEMALQEMRAIASEASSLFGEAQVAVAHRIGVLALGEASVAVAVAAPHRAVAFDACEFVIDELKRRVQIWKQEHYVEGPPTWRVNATET
jgi:molybdopterin synthase catalytic subunit